MRKKRVYIVGPASEFSNDSRQAFVAAARKEERRGHIVFNPATLPKGLEHHEYMQLCMPMLAMADDLVLLPGWGKDKRSRLIHGYARDLEMTIRYPDGIASYPSSVLKVTV